MRLDIMLSKVFTGSAAHGFEGERSGGYKCRWAVAEEAE